MWKNLQTLLVCGLYNVDNREYITRYTVSWRQQTHIYIYIIIYIYISTESHIRLGLLILANYMYVSVVL